MEGLKLMSEVNLKIFVVEGQLPVREEIVNGIKENYEMRNNIFGINEIIIEGYGSIDEIKTEIAERHKKSRNGEIQYLNVGILDLVPEPYRSKRVECNDDFSNPRRAIDLILNDVIPLYNNYCFKAIFVTKVIMFCEANADKKSNKLNDRMKYRYFCNRLDYLFGLLKNKKYIIHKKPTGYPEKNDYSVRGDGVVDGGVIKMIIEMLNSYIESNNSFEPINININNELLVSINSKEGDYFKFKEPSKKQLNEIYLRKEDSNENMVSIKS